MKFNKESDGKWYVDLPDWTGTHAELEMVSGADILLDMISGYKESVELRIATSSFCLVGPYYTLNLIGLADDIGNGAYYDFNNQLVIHNTNVDMKIWLCDVMLFVFDEFPKNIYFQVVK